MASTRTLSDLSLGSDAKGKDAFLIPADAYVLRREIAAAAREDVTLPAGTERVLLQYDSQYPVYVWLKKSGDSDLVTPSGDVTDGTAPFMDPPGLVNLQVGTTLQFICAAAATIHIVCGG